jgi:hypothetical protein
MHLTIMKLFLSFGNSIINPQGCIEAVFYTSEQVAPLKIKVGNAAHKIMKRLFPARESSGAQFIAVFWRAAARKIPHTWLPRAL